MPRPSNIKTKKNMEKKQYIKPDATIIELKGEILMLEVSKTGGESASEGTIETPEYGGGGNGDDY